MARRLNTNKEIDTYVASVIADAEHHAPKVKHVIQALADAVRAKLGASDSIDVYERNGVVARTCWVRIAGKRYCFSYNYSSDVIDLRDRGLQGSLRFAFDNATTAAQIHAQVAALKVRSEPLAEHMRRVRTSKQVHRISGLCVRPYRC